MSSVMSGSSVGCVGDSEKGEEGGDDGETVGEHFECFGCGVIDE
jgi:hypothetical protein